MKKILTGFWILAILFSSHPTYSQTRQGFVSDMLILTFRQGPGNTFSVLRTLKSDTPLTILEEKEGYYKAELGSGEIGWVDKQFIVFETPKVQIIEALNKKNANFKAKIETLSNSVEQLKEQLTVQKSDQREKGTAMEESLREALDKAKTLSSQLKESQTKYSTLEVQSKDVLEVVQKAKILEKENTLLSSKLAKLEKDTSHMFKTGMIKWFLAGVGVMLLGWIIGQSVSSKKKRSSLY